MLASITPLGERGRRSRWGVTVSAFVLGAVASGTALGAGLGALGSILPAGAGWRLAAFAAAALVALAIDFGLAPLPGPRRQVNERWLDDYRGWVYGVGFGAQLGVGVTTIVSSAATYLALACALLAGGPVRGALIVGVFGLVRGLTPLAAAGVDRPERLLSMHRSFARLREPAWRAGHALIAISCGAALAGWVS